MLPEGWVEKPLGSVSEITTGGTPSRGVAEYWGGDIPWMSSGEINQRVVREVAERITPAGLANSNARMLAPETIMIALNGQGKTRGKVAILNIETSCNQSLAGITPDRDLADPEYIFHYLESIYQRIRNITGDDARNGLNLKILRSISVVLPPLNEQRRIAEVLRAIDEAISATRELEQQVRTTSASLIEALVSRGISIGTTYATEIGDVPLGWDVVRLSDLLTIKHGFAFSSEYFSREDGETILLTPGNFSTNKSLYFGPNTKFYDGPIPEGFVLEDGDLLVVMTDLTQDMAILGNAVQLQCEKRVLHNQRIGKVEPIDTGRIDKCFARLILNSARVQKAVKATASGTTVRHTSPRKILEVSVALPPLDQQVEIAQIACEIEAASSQKVVADDRSLQSETFAQLVSVKAAVASDLLSGRVRVPA